MKCVVALLYITIRKHETCIIFTLSYDLSPLAVSPASVLCDCCFSAYQLRHYCLVSYAIIFVIAAAPVESRPAGGNTGYDGVFFWVSALHLHSHRWNGRRKRAYVRMNQRCCPPAHLTFPTISGTTTIWRPSSEKINRVLLHQIRDDPCTASFQLLSLY
jgi:hypothetical protein